jgi:hypothetical protein
MPKLEYFLLCESISVDQETNRVSLFNVLEDLHLAKPPTEGESKPAFILNQFVAVAVFNRQPEDSDQEFEACLKYNLPDGAYKEHKLKFKMERNRQRIVMRFVGMPPVGKDGLLSFDLSVNGNHSGTHTIQLFSEPEMEVGDGNPHRA